MGRDSAACGLAGALRGALGRHSPGVAFRVAPGEAGATRIGVSKVRLQKLEERLDRQIGVPDDRPEGSSIEAPVVGDGHGLSPRGVHADMAPALANHDVAEAFEGTHAIGTGDDG